MSLSLSRATGNIGLLGQTAIRGDLPETLTLIFRGITRLIDLPIVISWAIILIAIFYLKSGN